MGQLNHPRGGRIRAKDLPEAGNGRLARAEDVAQRTARSRERAPAHRFGVAAPGRIVAARAIPLRAWHGWPGSGPVTRSVPAPGPGVSRWQGSWTGAHWIPTRGSSPRRRAPSTGSGGPGTSTHRLLPATLPPEPRGTGETSATRASSVARLESPPAVPVRGGSVAGLSPWERLARALRSHRRVPASPLDPHRRHAGHGSAAHRHRPARARHDAGPRRRPVRQARRGDAQAHQARSPRPRDAGRNRRDGPADRA